MAEFKPKLRREAEIDLASAIRGAIWSQFLRTDIFPFQNCLQCTYFGEKEEFCKKHKAKPPARVIAYGCPDFDDVSEIPY